MPPIPTPDPIYKSISNWTIFIKFQPEQSWKWQEGTWLSTQLWYQNIVYIPLPNFLFNIEFTCTPSLWRREIEVTIRTHGPARMLQFWEKLKPPLTPFNSLTTLTQNKFSWVKNLNLHFCKRSKLKAIKLWIPRPPQVLSTSSIFYKIVMFSFIR